MGPDKVTINNTVSLEMEDRPPDYLFNMMGWWASVTGVLGFTANLLAIGTFLTVKKVLSDSVFLMIYLNFINYSQSISFFLVAVSLQLASHQSVHH